MNGSRAPDVLLVCVLPKPFVDSNSERTSLGCFATGLGVTFAGFLSFTTLTDVSTAFAGSAVTGKGGGTALGIAIAASGAGTSALCDDPQNGQYGTAL